MDTDSESDSQFEVDSDIDAVEVDAELRLPDPEHPQERALRLARRDLLRRVARRLPDTVRLPSLPKAHQRELLKQLSKFCPRCQRLIFGQLMAHWSTGSETQSFRCCFNCHAIVLELEAPLLSRVTKICQALDVAFRQQNRGLIFSNDSANEHV